jgi:hypothetical protein
MIKKYIVTLTDEEREHLHKLITTGKASASMLTRARILLKADRCGEHGGWTDTAEIELSVISRQCLKRRIPTFEMLAHETSEWARRRNNAGGSVDWRFTTEDARIKLNKLYPSISA